jgi:adenine-specific DNA methylase
MTEGQAFRKARGAFFTPDEITGFLADWAVRTPADRVLEPSCGEAAFLLAAASRLERLGARRPGLAAQLEGIEIHRESVERSRGILAAAGLPAAAVREADFFDCAPEPVCEAVIGNPPYIRYQNFTGPARLKAVQAALAGGVRLNGLASSWAAFVIHAARFLRPEGRLGLVLPGELLTVNYAAQVRRFLLGRFARVRLVMFETRVFPGVLEEVVLLLAEGSGGAASFEVYQARDLTDLVRLEASAWTGFAPGENGKWTPALLPAEAVAIYQRFCESGMVSPLLEWGSTYLGAVTGNNGFFTLSRAEIAEHGLAEADLLKISPPGARHLRGLTFTAAAWKAMVEEGGRGYLFYPRAEQPEGACARYIGFGEQKKVPAAYKCRVRKPWWRVPVVPQPDLLLTYMNHDRPRLVTNQAGVQLINSIYGVLLRPNRRALGRALLPVAALNSITLLGAEMVGRAYGGGLLKFEPREADQLPVPSLETVAALADRLTALRPQLATALRQNSLERAVELVDEVMLSQHLAVTGADLRALREARAYLFRRRTSRGRRSDIKVDDAPDR